jgi:16S rRNA (guanine527-N7)-methyltransferase
VISSRIVALLSPFLDLPCHPQERTSEGPALLSPAQLDQVSAYLDLLIRWNARINLTAVREAEYIVTRHFGESLFAARCLFPPGAPPSSRSFRQGEGVPSTGDEPIHLVDVGSGPGFPGLPIKIYAPHIRLTLIESNHRKVAFLREVVRTLTLTGVNVFSGRAENYLGAQPGGQGAPLSSPSAADPRADVVTLRAVERFPSILPTAANLLRPDGRLCLLIGQDQILNAAAILPKLRWAQPVAMPLASKRVVQIGHNTES